MAQLTINFQKRVDAELLKQVDYIYQQLGTSTGEAFRIFLAKTKEAKGFPFDMTLKNSREDRVRSFIKRAEKTDRLVSATTDERGNLVVPYAEPEYAKD